jgi:hypothetical protein
MSPRILNTHPIKILWPCYWKKFNINSGYDDGAATLGIMAVSKMTLSIGI